MLKAVFKVPVHGQAILKFKTVEKHMMFVAPSPVHSFVVAVLQQAGHLADSHFFSPNAILTGSTGRGTGEWGRTVPKNNRVLRVPLII
jgi:hypothetical protein